MAEVTCGLRVLTWIKARVRCEAESEHDGRGETEVSGCRWNIWKNVWKKNSQGSDQEESCRGH